MIEHVILDLDDTLIYSKSTLKHSIPDFIINYGESNMNIVKRDGFDNFIDYLFNNYKTVSVWSAGSTEWVNDILPMLFGDRYKQLAFILDRRYVSRINCSYKNRFAYCKQMDTHIWNSNLGKIFNMNRHNTVLIDDSPTHARYNGINVIRIDKFNPELPKDKVDTELLRIMKILSKWKYSHELIPHRRIVSTRLVNKKMQLLYQHVLPISKQNCIYKYVIYKKNIY
jgi:hypothetical protein